MSISSCSAAPTACYPGWNGAPAASCTPRWVFERYAATRAGQLSGGTLAKLNLGLALLPDPQVLLLDEPYAGFDFDTYLKFWDLVAQRQAAGKSVLIISHFVTDEEHFDRIIQLRDGKAVPR